MIYPNNSFILITEIGQTSDTPNNGLQCITDRRPCCSSPNVANRQGQWYFPDNGGVVPRPGDNERFSRTRGVNGEVTLNRANNDVMMPTGRFCCVVPDAMSTEVTLCTNVGECISFENVLFYLILPHFQYWSYQLPCPHLHLLQLVSLCTRECMTVY